jgi:hypothetical protein
MLTGMSAFGVMYFPERNDIIPFQCVLSSGIESLGTEEENMKRPLFRMSEVRLLLF